MAAPLGITNDPAQSGGDGAALIRLGQVLGAQRKRGAGLGRGAPGEGAIEPPGTEPGGQAVAQTGAPRNDQTVKPAGQKNCR